MTPRSLEASVVGPGKTSDGVLPGLFFGGALGLAGTRIAIGCVMREEDNPKQPRPVRVPKKGTNSPETAEVMPWRPLQDLDRDRHRHI